MARRSQNVLRALAMLLVAVLAWPWGLSASALENSLQRVSTLAGASIRAKTLSPAKRSVRSNKWAAVATPAFMEGDEESPEDGDDGDGDDEFLACPLISLPPSAILFAESFPSRITPPPPGGHSRQIDRLRRFRC